MVQIIADSHVHIHDCFLIDELLDNALKNFNECLVNNENSFGGRAYLMFLAEMAGQDYFTQLFKYASNHNHIGNWTFYHTKETVSLYAENDNKQKIYLIAGSQIITKEKVEVLNLISSDRFRDGFSLETTITKIIDCGGLPLMPWGFGKWIGKRGKLIRNILTSDQFYPLFLGDNGGRPLFWRYSPYFRIARKKGIKILSGTDPLGIKTEFKRVGTFGFTVNNYLNPEQPGQSIKHLLLNPQIAIESFGKLQQPLTFFRNQLLTRIN